MGKARLNTISILSPQPQDLLLPEKIGSTIIMANHFSLPLTTNSSCLDIVSVKSSYTSLEDLLPLSSPIGISWDEIPIKNKLVKKAASAYLQPMSSSRERKNMGFFKWLGKACSFNSRSNSDSVNGCGCLDFVQQIIRDSFGQFFRVNRSRGSVDSDSPLKQIVGG